MPEDNRTNVHRALSQYNHFFRDLTENLIRDALDETKVRMRKANWDEKIIDSVKMSEVKLDESTGEVSGKITADYVSTRIQPDGKSHSFNVTEGMEYGTQPHYITRRWAPLLRWVDKHTGQLRSAFAVFNPGMGKGAGTHIQKLGVITDTRVELEPKMQAVINSASTQFFLLTLHGQPIPNTWYNRGDLA